MNTSIDDARANRQNSASPRPFGKLPRWVALRTIRGHLYVALGATTATTVVCASIAFYTFKTVGQTTTEIAQRNFRRPCSRSVCPRKRAH